MKRLTLYISLAFAALTLAIAVPVAFSRGPGPGHGPGPGDGDGPRGDRHAYVMKQLGLTPEQTTALEALRQDHRDDVDSLHEQMQAKREAIKALWLTPNPDRAQILAAEREIGALRQQIAESRVDFLFAVKGVLTPEQFGKFIELRKDGRGFGHHERGWRRGGGECRGGGDCPFGGPRRGPPADGDD